MKRQPHELQISERQELGRLAKECIIGRLRYADSDATIGSESELFNALAKDVPIDTSSCVQAVRVALDRVRELLEVSP